MSASPSLFGRLLSAVHGWLGIVVLPLVIVIGLTGLYFNHPEAVKAYLPQQSSGEEQFDDWPNPQPVTQDQAAATAKRMFGAEPYRLRRTDVYHLRPVFIFQTKAGVELVVDKATGYAQVIGRTEQATYDPNGQQVHHSYDYDTLFRSLHQLGWIDGRFGSWLADITAGALVLFGLTGVFMFIGSLFRRKQPDSAPIDLTTPTAAAMPVKTVPRTTTPRPQRIKLE